MDPQQTTEKLNPGSRVFPKADHSFITYTLTGP